MKQHENELHLALWCEVIGTFGGCITNGNFLYIKINGSLFTFPIESNEVLYVREKLDENLIGKKVGILHTDEPARPLLIRFIEGE
jgi:hypothetical protein